MLGFGSTLVFMTISIVLQILILDLDVANDSGFEHFIHIFFQILIIFFNQSYDSKSLKR